MTADEEQLAQADAAGAEESAPAIAGGPRLEWRDVPGRVRTGVEDLLGSPVVAADNQTGGFSPGLAARVRCANGRRAFVKAVGSSQNPRSPGIYRAEARVAQHLPADAPAPRFHGTYDDGRWVALVFDEIQGRAPREPWLPDELALVVDAVTDLSRTLTPCPVDDLPTASTQLLDEMLSYTELAAAPPDDLDPWERRHLDGLAELAASALDHIDGDTLVHLDLRADNVLLDGERVWFVDWPWACRGPSWMDSVMLQINAALHGHDPEPHLDANPLLAGVDPEHVTALIAGFCGFFSATSRQPSPPGLPTLRDFQRAQHVSTLAWLRRRTGWD